MAQSQLGHAVQEPQRRYKEAEIQDKPNTLRGQWWQMAEWQYRQRTERRIRSKNHHSLFDVQIVLLSLEPDPLIHAVDRDAPVVERGGKIIIRKVAIESPPTGQQSTANKESQQSGEHDQLRDRYGFGMSQT